ncbi:MAG: carbohydrate ABC transporter permease [Spirochaetales bacterium]|nr:carbohydrate ABC transporter permease [Spirochaetales bacterium]
MKRKYIGSSIEKMLFRTFNTAIMIFLVIVTLYPFAHTIAISFNESLDTIRGGIYLWPRVFTLYNYKAVLSNITIYNAFFISLSRTVLATVFQVIITSMFAYALSRSNYIFRKPITIIVVLTMYFNAGLIPVYFLYKNLGLINNYLVYIAPAMFGGAFNFIVLRTYIRNIPESIIESAKMDGAGEFRIFFQIIFPVCKPVLATVALFVAVYAWNSWFDSFIFCSSKQYLSTLQYELMKLIAIANIAQSNSALLRDAMASGGEAAKSFASPIAIRAAVTIIASVPIIIVYPFLQRYFIHGLVVGSVKE